MNLVKHLISLFPGKRNELVHISDVIGVGPAEDVVTEHHRLRISESGIRVQRGQLLVRASSWFTSNQLLAVSSHGEEKANSGPSSPYKGTNPIMETVPSQPHLTLIITQKSHLQRPSHGVSGLQHLYFGGALHA